MGFGWSHSLAWEIEERRTALVVHHANGTRIVVAKLEVGQQVLGPKGLLIRRTPDGFYLDADDGVHRLLQQLPGDESGSYRLTRIHDANNNALTLGYDSTGNLTTVSDSVGRQARFCWSDGAIQRLEMFLPTEQRWACFARYTVDVRGDLVLAEDSEGSRSRFVYDEAHRLTEHERPSGLVFHYVYDAQNRCVETWGDRRNGVEPAFGPATSKTLADGSPARGVHHVKLAFHADGYREVIDVRTVSRYFANRHGTIDKAVVGSSVTSRQFDEHGHETTTQDATGAVWRYHRDARGRVLRTVDPLGRTTDIVRDDAGRPVLIKAPNGGQTRFDRDSRGNVERRTDAEGGIESFKYDERGLLLEHVSADSQRRCYRWDALGNLVEARFPNGACYRYEFDDLGRRTATVNPRGDRFETLWNLRGDVLRKVDPLGGVTSFTWDGQSRLIRETRPDNTVWEYVYGGLRSLCEVRKPDGRTTRIEFDIDERPLVVHDSNNETHQFSWNSRGFVSTETRWDGHETRYKYDELGQPTQIRTSGGDLLELEYDPAGQLVCKRFRDGSEHRFHYDSMGRIERATSPGCAVSFERNRLGGVVKETQTVDGEAVEVFTRFAPCGAPSVLTTSLGHAITFTHDSMGQVQVIGLGSSELNLTRDQLGQVAVTTLPSGAQIESRFDALNRLIERGVKVTQHRMSVGDLEPVWLGGSARSIERLFSYSPTSSLLSVVSPTPLSSRSYRYDVSDRLTELQTPSTTTSLRYDGSTNAFPPEGARYGKGGALEQWGAWRYQRDAEGRIIRKTRDADGARFEFEWAADGTLRSTTTPDGMIVRHRYDPFGRRLHKVVRSSPRSPSRTRHTTRFVWDQDRLLQERTLNGAQQTGRDFVLDLESFAPIAQADISADGSRTWCFYLNDHGGAPEELLDIMGRSVAAFQATPWGRVQVSGSQTTPLQRQGEYVDTESASVYNRYRHIELENGRFLSPDPIGLKGGMNPYVAGPNSVCFMDPFGLSVESDRAAQVRDNQDGSGFSTTTSVARLENGDTIVTDSRGSLNPSTRIRDPSMNNSRGTPGGAANGGVDSGEWVPRAAEDSHNPDIPNPHHAERRAIEEAERRGTKIQSISATNNCCPTCRQALRRHNPDIIITDANGNPAPDP
jgi:RHS repeat-associated protein